jgi:death on curing protein
VSDLARSIDYLSVDDLLEIAAGVLGRFTVRDSGLLASAAARPATTVLGVEAYPTLVDKTACLMHSLARNHPLLDGNKRLAWSAARVFCLINGYDIELGVDDAEALIVGAAEGRLDAPQIAAILARSIAEVP